MTRRMNYELPDIDDAAVWLWEQAAGCRTWCFGSGMGTGKTSLIRAVCRQAGVREEVSSPTFPIIQEYAGFREGRELVIAHMDLYRLGSEREGREAGVSEAMRLADYSFVEWPQQLPGLIPGDHALIGLNVLGSDGRELTVTFVNPSAA